MLGVEGAQALAVVHSGHDLDPEARVDEKFGELRGIQLTRVERVEGSVAPGRERNSVRGAHEQFATGRQHAVALAQELCLIPQVLDHLEIDDRVDGAVRERQFREIAVQHLHSGVPGTDVLDRGDVVVESRDLRRHIGNHVGAVAFSGTRLEHVATRATGEQVAVDHLVPPEPVVLLGDSGHRSLARQRQCRGIVGRCRPGVEGAGCGTDCGFAHPSEVSGTARDSCRGGPHHSRDRPLRRLW